jgi:copper chaperone CopZ
MKNKKIITILIAALMLNAVVGAVWLIAAGHAEMAILTLIRWSEDGTMNAFEALMLDRVIPMVVGFAVAASALYVAMRKKFKLIDLDCANCAAKMEEAIKKIDGVTDASVSFMTQKMMIEADDAVFDKVVEEAVKCIAKVEPDCQVVL